MAIIVIDNGIDMDKMSGPLACCYSTLVAVRL